MGRWDAEQAEQRKRVPNTVMDLRILMAYACQFLMHESHSEELTAHPKFASAPPPEPTLISVLRASTVLSCPTARDLAVGHLRAV